MTSGLFAPDGCVIPNVDTRQYEITFEAKCEHVKIRKATYVIEAESLASAWLFAGKWLHLNSLRGQTMITEVQPVDAWDQS